jgi:hypothetical protein
MITTNIGLVQHEGQGVQAYVEEHDLLTLSIRFVSMIHIKNVSFDCG